jgi:mycothiol synthase
MFHFTPKQGQYLAFIHHYTQVHRQPPAQTDIQRFFGVTPPTVHQMILKLEEKGLLKRTPHQARSIEVLVPAEQLPPLQGIGREKTEPRQDDEPQLQMVWPEQLVATPPKVELPDGYTIRTYEPGDEARFYEVMAQAGWSGWNDEKLKPWLSRILPDGWFMIISETNDEIAATAMCLHNYKEVNPFQGELGWLACDPAHRGRGLGLVVSAAVTARLIGAGYRRICLYTEDFRLGALKTYLKLRYVPLLYSPQLLGRWQAICEQLQWPYTPEVWKRQGGDLWV